MDSRSDTEMFGKMHLALEIIEGCREFADLIPEVRANLVFAREKARGPEDVLGVEGRITVVDGMPRAAGLIRLGASSHMARLILECNKREGSIRAGLNFANDPELAEWLEGYCREQGWAFSCIDRGEEPPLVARVEGGSMPWKVGEAVRAAGGMVPKVFYETGAVGKEPVSVIVGTDPIEVAEEACEIARRYAAFRNTARGRRRGRVGKIDLDTFEEFVLPRLGKKDAAVIVPPLTGVDAAVIDIGHGKVLIVAEDPIFQAPRQEIEMFGWYTVHIGASDVAVMGARPQWMTYTLLMPSETDDEVFRTIVDSIHRTALELEIAIVGGHTGYYPAVVLPLIGGVTVFALADRDAYVTPAGARPDNHVVLTKGPGIESVGILSWLYEERLRRNLPAEIVERAKALRYQMTVVRDALTAMEVGGVTAMHDATEGGVIGGLFEMANASGVGMEIDESRFVYPDELRLVLELLELDPVECIAEGSLLLTIDPDRSGALIARLGEEGIAASVVGTVTQDPGSRFMKRRDGRRVSLAIPQQDPFWPVFFEGVESVGG